MVNKKDLEDLKVIYEDLLEASERRNDKKRKEQTEEIKTAMEGFVNKKLEEVKTSILEESKHRRSNEKNVIMYGIHENVQDLKKEVETVFNEMDMPEAPQDIAAIFRIGKPQKSKIRPVKVCFHCTHSAEKALRNKKLLKEKMDVYVNEDLTPEQMNELKTLKDEAKKRNEEDEKNGETWIVVGRRTNPKLKKIKK